jgi:predicted transcriptional regulator of viral defense system
VARQAKPSWDLLYQAAAEQRGYFTTRQAEQAGYSSQLLLKYLKNGRVVRTRRSVYRLVHFPAGDHEELMVLWLWSAERGVFSHQTALWLHGLSDLPPAEEHLTLPAEWSARRLRVPAGAKLHFADLEPVDWTWDNGIPVTSRQRTVDDCATCPMPPELLSVAQERVPNLRPEPHASAARVRALAPPWSDRLETRLL